MEFYVTAGPGTEGVLRDELCELGFRSARLNHGGIPFLGDWIDGARACLQSRIGQRVMLVLGRTSARTLEDVYEACREVEWQEFLTPSQTFAVATYAHESCGENPNMVTLKVKDAVADQCRAVFGARPNVDRESPDVRIFVYWARERVTIYLDMSGEPLFKRGYRQSGGEAPLKETLAAAMLRLSGWDRSTPLVDPMCGSGTLVIEAALWAGNHAPGLWRKRFGFERWANFTPEMAQRMSRLRGEMRRGVAGQMPRITGFDLDEEVLKTAQVNAQAAGLRLSFRRMPLRELAADGTRRLLIANPPYGVRLDASNQLYQELANAVHRLHGWRVCLLVGNPRLQQAIHLKPEAEYALKNGSIDCKLLVYEV